MSEPPPSRYRVVERGRRLVVIDRATGAEAGRSPDPRGVGADEAPWGRLSLPGLPRQTSFDGSSELTTHPLYDEKAPRTIRLDPGSAATLGRVRLVGLILMCVAVIGVVAQPALLAILAVFASRQMRDRLRGAATRWLDRVEAEAS